MGSDHDHLLDPQALADLEHRPIAEVRAQRAACVEVETGLSYLRRLIQGSLDIVGQAIEQRGADGAAIDVADLVDQLPSILGDALRPNGNGRLVETLEPTTYDTELGAEYEQIVSGGRVARAADLEDAELAQLLDQLRELERRVSAQRHEYHERIDALQAELTRRYRTGEATVDALLRDAN
jgi:hypothetical protein